MVIQQLADVVGRSGFWKDDGTIIREAMEQSVETAPVIEQ